MPYFLNFRKRPNGGEVVDSLQQLGVFEVAFGSPVAVTNSTCSKLEDALLGKHLIFATHGFNVHQDDGYAQLSNWASLLQLDDSFLFIGMVWPGDSSWLGPLCYPGEGRQAMDCGNILADFITTHAAGAASLSMVSHSLGARFILQAIARLAALPEPIAIRQVAIMAGAVNDDCLTDEYQAAAANIAKINLLVSKEDEVLKWAFPPGNLTEGIIDKGHPYWLGALGREGPRSLIPGKMAGPYLIPNAWEFGHGNYIAVAPALNPLLTLAVPFPDATPAMKPVVWQPCWTAAFVSSRFK